MLASAILDANRLKAESVINRITDEPVRASAKVEAALLRYAKPFEPGAQFAHSKTRGLVLC